MKELKEIFVEIAIIFAKNFSDALLQSASDLTKLKQANSQSSIIKSQMIENPKIESLKIGDVVIISVIYRKKNARYGGKITNIDGDKITVNNDVLGKNWVVGITNILFQEVSAYEIE